MEHLFAQIFDRRDRIKDQLWSQAESYNHSLASRLLSMGRRPPPWIWDAGPDVREMNRKEMISGFLFSAPRITTPSVYHGSSFCQSSALFPEMSHLRKAADNAGVLERDLNALAELQAMDTCHGSGPNERNQKSAPIWSNSMVHAGNNPENQKGAIDTSNSMRQSGRMTRLLATELDSGYNITSSQNKNSIGFDSGVCGPITRSRAQKLNCSTESTKLDHRKVVDYSNRHPEVTVETSAVDTCPTADRPSGIQRSKSRQKDIEKRLCEKAEMSQIHASISNVDDCTDRMTDANVDLCCLSKNSSPVQLKQLPLVGIDEHIYRDKYAAAVESDDIDFSSFIISVQRPSETLDKEPVCRKFSHACSTLSCGDVIHGADPVIRVGDSAKVANGVTEVEKSGSVDIEYNSELLFCNSWSQPELRTLDSMSRLTINEAANQDPEFHFNPAEETRTCSQERFIVEEKNTGRIETIESPVTSASVETLNAAFERNEEACSSLARGDVMHGADPVSRVGDVATVSNQLLSCKSRLSQPKLHTLEEDISQDSETLISSHSNHAHEMRKSSQGLAQYVVEDEHCQGIEAIESPVMSASVEPPIVASERNEENCLNDSNLGMSVKRNIESSSNLALMIQEGEQPTEESLGRDTKKARMSLGDVRFLEEINLHNASATRSLETTKLVCCGDDKEELDHSVFENPESFCQPPVFNSESSQFLSLLPSAPFPERNNELLCSDLVWDCKENNASNLYEPSVVTNGERKYSDFPAVFPSMTMPQVCNTLSCSTSVKDYVVNSSSNFSGSSMVLNDVSENSFQEFISLMNKEPVAYKSASLSETSYCQNMSTSSLMARSEARKPPLTPPVRMLNEARKPPLTPPVRKLSNIISGKSLSSSVKMGSNPELICFRIDENSSIEEQNGPVGESFKEKLKSKQIDSSTRKILGDVSWLYENASNLVLDPNNNNESSNLGSTKTSSYFRSQMTDGHCISNRYTGDNIPAMVSNRKVFPHSFNSARKTSESLCSGSNNPRLFKEGKEATIEEVIIKKGGKPNNIVSNISSFIPLVRQKQQAALPIGKRDIKVKALEAAEAAKRLQEKRQNEREMRKDELRKKREADNAARKRQREEDEKKEKERKKRCAEETKKPHKQLGRGNRVEKEKPQKVEFKSKELAGDGREHRDFVMSSGVPDCRNRSDSELTQPSNLVDPSDDDSRLRFSLKYAESFKESSGVEKVDLVLGGDTKNTIQDRMSSTESQSYMSYEISPYKDSDDEDADIQHKRKPIPSWAREECLQNILLHNLTIDPREIFSRNASFNLNEVFPPATPRPRLL